MGDTIAGTFSSNPEVITVITTYLMILPLTYGAHGVVVLIMVSLNVLRRPRTALLLTFTRLMLLYIPLAFLGSQLWGLKGLFAGAALGNILAGVFAWFLIRKGLSGAAFGAGQCRQWGAGAEKSADQKGVPLS